MDGTGGPPISDSVVLVAGVRVRAAGSRANIPIPAAADKINGAGKFLVPGLIDVYPAGSARPVDAVTISMNGLEPAAAEAILDEARKRHTPVTAHVRTLADARFLVDNGVSGFLGMIRDTEEIDPAFLDRLRNLQIVFAPVLVRLDRARPEFAVALHNTRRLAAWGVPIAVGSAGLGSLRETELLVEAGLSPADVLVAATRNGALALHKLAEVGTIERGKRADLLLLTANPAEDIRNLRQADRVMRDGLWADRGALVVP